MYEKENFYKNPIKLSFTSNFTHELEEEEEGEKKLRRFSYSSIILIRIRTNSLQQFQTGAKSILSLTMTLPLNARSGLF